MPGSPAKDSSPCSFCASERPLVAEGQLWVAFRDAYPVNQGQTLLVPRRPVASFRDLSAEGFAELPKLILEVTGLLDAELSPDGYNYGVNDGGAAGQTVFHVHVIPRFDKDTSDPRGGVRKVKEAVVPYP